MYGRGVDSAEAPSACETARTVNHAPSRERLYQAVRSGPEPLISIAPVGTRTFVGFIIFEALI